MGKKSVLGSFIAAICIMIYLGALVYASVMIYLSIDQRKKTAAQEFEQIYREAQIEGRDSFMDGNFIQKMYDALKASITIEALIITDTNSGQAFEKKKGHAVEMIDGAPRFKNKFIFSNQVYYRSLDINVRDANIKAIASAFNFQEFSNILKITLIIILIGFALSFFTIIVNLLLAKTGKKEKIVYVKNTSFSPAEEKKVPEERNYATPEEKNEIPVVSAADTESGPNGLYSTRSNIGWEEYTKDRLDSEIHRCASTDKDLALIVMEFTQLENDAMFAQAAEEAVKFFTSRDLVFEYGKQGITVIIPSASLDVSINKAEKFHQRIFEKLKQDIAFDLCIGLSSRSGRLLNADRLMMEAKEALKKAKSDSTTSIIAFRSDPDKYRAFIASQN